MRYSKSRHVKNVAEVRHAAAGFMTDGENIYICLSNRREHKNNKRKKERGGKSIDV